MVGVFLKRCCNPAELTPAEIAAIDLVVAPEFGAEQGYKHRLGLMVGAIQEFALRGNGGGVFGWMTDEEKIDAFDLAFQVIGGRDLLEVWLVLYYGEEGIYTTTEVESILGLAIE